MKKRTIFMAVLALAASGHLAGQINVPNYWGIDAWQLAFSGWLFLGQPSSITTDYDTAIACYTMAIENAPNEKVYYINRGWAYNQKGDYDKAIADYTQAIRLDPNEKVYYNNRGWAYNKKGDYDKAIADCTRAIQIDPSDPYPYKNRGIAYMRKKDYQKARADLDKALQLKSDFADAKTAREELRKLGY